MTKDEILRLYKNNRDAEWQQAHRIALLRFLDQGMSLIEADEATDTALFNIDWELSRPY